jgi:hypothetical protein
MRLQTAQEALDKLHHFCENRKFAWMSQTADPKIKPIDDLVLHLRKVSAEACRRERCVRRLPTVPAGGGGGSE